MTAIYDLTPDALRAKADERDQLYQRAVASGHAREASAHWQMRELYLMRASQLERSDPCECVSTN